MRRWFIRIGFMVFLGMSVFIGLAWWQPRYLLVATAAIAPEFMMKWTISWRERMSKYSQEQQLRNLETEVIRIEIEGNKFNIPMRYTYGKAIERYGRWPKAKPERVKVGSLSLSVLMPDLKPYYLEDDARWKVKGWGERIEVMITNSLGIPDWFQKYRSRYFDGQDQYSTRKEVIHNLVLFASHGGMSDTYFPTDETIELTISCNKESRSDDSFPSCYVKSNYRPGIALSYSFAKEYLLNWLEIDKKLKILFDQFELTSNSLFTK